MHSLRVIMAMNDEELKAHKTDWQGREDRIDRENRVITLVLKATGFGIFMLAVAVYGYFMV